VSGLVRIRFASVEVSLRLEVVDKLSCLPNIQLVGDLDALVAEPLGFTPSLLFVFDVVVD
jgi:hypothetical protein